ncbi:MAG: hypothetical protein LBH60_02380 [Prevotellaceae bacterium]|jgi:hypothetical protein|nr:hypothetical protein [Prevotellaceae bacterium]
MKTKNTNNKKRSRYSTKPESKSLFERFNSYLEQKHRTVICIILTVAALFSFLLFDAKIYMMGDDSDYLIYGYNFAKNFAFPGYRGPLYPILLSPFIALFGINIILIKTLSAMMIIGSIFFMYKAFYGRVPALILFSCLTLLSTNSFLLFYSSAVLSEPLFLLIQSMLIFFFCRYFIDAPNTTPIRKQIPQFFLIALLTLCLTLTRTVGYAAVGVIAIYFLFFGQWKKALTSVAVNAAVFGLFGLLKKLVWPLSGSAYNLKEFFTKDMYNPALGMEDAGGIIVRLFENIMTYLSKYVCRFAGLRTDISTGSIFAAIIVVAAFLIGGYLAYRKNRTLFFAALHTLGFCLANFIILHATWMQERFIIVYYPLILFVILSGIYYMVHAKPGIHIIYIAVVAILFLGSFRHTWTKTGNNLVPLQKYLSGNVLYGLSPDWTNYIQASKLIAKEAPDSVNIAVRKPSTSTIYTNRPFHGIYRLPSISRDSLETWKQADGKAIFIMDLTDTDKLNRLPRNIFSDLTFVAEGQSIETKTRYRIEGIFEIDRDDSILIKYLVDSLKINYTFDYDQYRDDFVKSPDTQLYSPDMLLDNMKKANVRYMILASLRINEAANTGHIINTLHRYLQFMRYKYPNIAVRKFATGNTEPATVYELRY